MYAHVTNGTVDAIGEPPQLVDGGDRWYDLRPRDAATLAKVGWYEVVETPRPADTATHTTDASYTFANGKVTQTWVSRPKTADELASDTANKNRATIQQQALTALDTNRTYLQIGSPTNAQTLAEVQALARQMNGVIRLSLNKLDAAN